MNTKKKILIIEDEQILGDILLSKLTSEGYETYWEKNGNTGLSKMREIKPDLVLLDIVMPEKDGYEVLQEVQLDGSLKNIPIVIISNSGQPVELRRILELGAKDYIVKADFSPNEVLEKVKKYINTDNTSPDEEQRRKNRNIKILITEDDPFLASLTSRRLTTEGYTVSLATDGAQALKAIESEIPDLLLLDVVMPEMNGFEVLKIIKADQKYNKMGVIIFSNLGQEHEIEEAKKLGADEFMVKANFTPKQVVENVKIILHKRGKL